MNLPKPALRKHSLTYSSSTRAFFVLAGYTTWSLKEPWDKYGRCGNHIIENSSAAGFVTAPETGSHNHANTRSNDVFPHPFGPVINKCSFRLISKDSSLSKMRVEPSGSGAPTETLSNRIDVCAAFSFSPSPAGNAANIFSSFAFFSIANDSFSALSNV